jgi:hypothetical protein
VTSGIQILLNLIPTGVKLHGGAIMALVHILIDVLDCFNRGDKLYIIVAAILLNKIREVADHPSIVNLKFVNCISLESVGALGACVRVL